MQTKYLVTGVTSGIGYGVAKSLLASGAFVVGIGRNISKVKELSEIYRDRFIFHSLNLSDVENIEGLFGSHLVHLEKYDGMVLCAGVEESLPLQLYTTEKIRAIFDINVFSNIELIRNFSKKKYSNDNASIVVLSSVMGELGEAGKIGYCATKAALLGVVKSSALELARRGIRVNAVSPAIVNTPLTDILFEKLTEDWKTRIISMHPSGLGEVEDVVPLIMFLLSDGSRWITGQNLKIDGGYSIR